jgi:predicted membrane protein
MKPLLTQFAVILGGAVATAVLLWNFYVQEMDLLAAVFRAALVFFATVIVLFLFLQFFSGILVRFVAEEVLKQRAEEQTPTEEKKETAKTPPTRQVASTATPRKP